MAKKQKLPGITPESWAAWRSTIGVVTKDKAIPRSLIKNGVDVDSVIELLASDKPPRWMAQCYYDWASDIFDNSPGFMLVWLIYLEWRNDMSSGDAKYKLYPADRGVRQELNRLLVLAGGEIGVPPSKDVVQTAASYVATSIVRLWAGLPRKEWLANTTPVKLSDAAASTKRTTTQKWNELVKYITDNGVAPTWSKLSELEAMNLAVALSTGDNATINQFHTRVTGVIDGH